MTAPSAKKSSDSEALPPPAADQVHLWLATRDAVTDSDGLTRAVLSRYTGCPPASLAFARGPHGKPQLLGGARALSFNLSDSGPWLALAVSGAAAVGVDLEFCDPARDVLKLARRCFRAAEIADMEAREGARLLDRFYDYWTLKEAGVKAVGGSRYISGAGGANYLDHVEFDRQGLSVEYMAYNPLPWPQQHGEFTPYVTGLDLIAACGAGSADHLRPGTIPWRERLAQRRAADEGASHE